MRTAAAALAALALSACCRPCRPCSEPAAEARPPFNDGAQGDVRGGRPENVYPAPGETTAAHDVRDLEARPGFDRDAATRALREAAPSAWIRWDAGRVVATGPDLAQAAVVAWLVRARAGASVAAAEAPPAPRARYFDVRDLPLAGADDGPSSGPDWLREVRAATPSTELVVKGGTLVARGPADELAEIGRRLDARRAQLAAAR